MSGRRHIVLAAALALASAGVASAANTIGCWKIIASQPCAKYIVGDTEAGLPSSGVPEGVPAWAKDTDRLVCYYGGSWQPRNSGSGGGLASTDIDTSAELRAILTDEVGTGALLFGLDPTMTDGLTCSADQVVKRNAGDTAFECGTIAAGDPTLAGDVDGAGSANDLDEAAVEVELESILDLSDLQGAVTDSQVPNTITVDNAAAAATASDLSCTNCIGGTEIDESSLVLSGSGLTHPQIMARLAVGGGF